LRAVPEPRSLPGVTIRWFTDADRQDMRNAKDERRVLDELQVAEARNRSPGGVPVTEAQLRKIENLRIRIDPFRRRRD
jgi:hypothetical protein